MEVVEVNGCIKESGGCGGCVWWLGGEWGRRGVWRKVEVVEDVEVLEVNCVVWMLIVGCGGVEVYRSCGGVELCGGSGDKRESM